MMRFPRTIAALALAACVSLASVASVHAEPEPAFMRHLFAPELVMQHQSAIGLGTGQRERITKRIREVQAEVLELQWKMNDAVESLEAAVAADPPKRDAAVDAAGRIFLMERDVKLLHLDLLLTIREELSAEQRTRLGELRDGAAR